LRADDFAAVRFAAAFFGAGFFAAAFFAGFLALALRAEDLLDFFPPFFAPFFDAIVFVSLNFKRISVGDPCFLVRKESNSVYELHKKHSGRTCIDCHAPYDGSCR
jgi:hypothetical protein